MNLHFIKSFRFFKFINFIKYYKNVDNFNLKLKVYQILFQELYYLGEIIVFVYFL